MDAHLDVEITCAGLIAEGELIGGAVNIGARAGNIDAAGDGVDRAARCGSADIRAGVTGCGGKGGGAVRSDLVGGRGAVADAVDAEGVGRARGLCGCG